MKSKVLMQLLSIILISFFWGSPKTAEACPAGGDGDECVNTVGLITLAILVTDISMTVHDIRASKKGPSPGYGLLETIIAGPQFAFSTYFLWSLISEEGDYAAFTSDVIIVGAISLWTGWLTYNGVNAFIRGRRTVYRKQKESKTPKLSYKLTPTVVTDGKKVGTGIGFVGSF